MIMQKEGEQIPGTKNREKGKRKSAYSLQDGMITLSTDRERGKGGRADEVGSKKTRNEGGAERGLHGWRTQFL